MKTCICLLGLSLGLLLQAQEQSLPPVALQQAPRASTTDLRGRLDELSEIEASVVAKLQEMDELVAKTEHLNTPENNGKLGRIEMALFRAQLYLAEREARLQVEDAYQELALLVTRYLRSREALDLAWQHALMSAAEQATVRQRPAASSADASQVAYFEVKEAANLQQIAALPAVYGDGSMWRLLMHCNPGVVAGMEEMVPVGTRLLVPNIHVVRQFDFE